VACSLGVRHGDVTILLADDAAVDGLLEAVAGCMEADSPMGPLGMRHHEEEGFWEV
jgi:hypothetical protein